MWCIIMRLLFIEGERPTGKLNSKDMPRFDKDKNCILIPIWYVYYLAEKCNVSKKSAFWHILNHEILHYSKGHRVYPLDEIKSLRDVQKFASYYKKIELAAMPKPIDEETKILNICVQKIIHNEIKGFYKNYQQHGKVY